MRISLEDIPTFIGMVAGASLALSVAYEFGYLATIDYRLIWLFTVQDAVVGAIHVVPITIILIALLYLSMRVRQGELHDKNYKVEQKQLRPIDRVKRFLSSRIFWIFIFGFFLSGISSPLVACLIFLAMAAVIAIQHWATKQKDNPWTLPLVDLSFVVYFLLLTALLGASFAAIDLRSEARDYQLVMANGESRVGLLMRSGEKVLLFRDDVRVVRVVPLDEVKEVTVYSVRSKSSIIAQIIGFLKRALSNEQKPSPR